MNDYIQKLVEEILESKVCENEDLFFAGLDSLKVLKMISHIEDHFDIEIDDEDLSIDKLCTVSAITNMVSNYIA